MNLSEVDSGALAAIAFHQPIRRNGVRDITRRDISLDLIGRLTKRDLIGRGPRVARRGAPYAFVATEADLAAFGTQS